MRTLTWIALSVVLSFNAHAQTLGPTNPYHGVEIVDQGQAYAVTVHYAGLGLWGLAPPYPVNAYIFTMPKADCSDADHCNTKTLIAIEERHIVNDNRNVPAVVSYQITEGTPRTVTTTFQNSAGQSVTVSLPEVAPNSID